MTEVKLEKYFDSKQPLIELIIGAVFLFVFAYHQTLGVDMVHYASCLLIGCLLVGYAFGELSAQRRLKGLMVE